MPSSSYDKTYQQNNYSGMRKRSLERQDEYDEYNDPYTQDGQYSEQQCQQPSMATINNQTVNLYQSVPAIQQPIDDNMMKYDDDDDYYDDDVGGVDGGVNNCDDIGLMLEDRQWDSGGRGTSMNKILPKIPIKHSNSVNDEMYYRDDGQPVLLPTGHQPLKKSRLLPQPQPQPQIPIIKSQGICVTGSSATAVLLASSTLTTSSTAAAAAAPPTTGQYAASLPTTPRILPSMPLRAIAGQQRQRQTPFIRRTDTEYSDQVS